MIFSIKVENGYPLVDVCGETVLLATGCQWSALRGSYAPSPNGDMYQRLQHQGPNGADPASIAILRGERLWGYDVVSDAGCALVVNLLAGHVRLWDGAGAWARKKISSRDAGPTTDEERFVVDTATPVSLLPLGAPAHPERGPRSTFFSVALGNWIDVPIVRQQVVAFGRSRTLRVGGLHQIGGDAVGSGTFWLDRNTPCARWRPEGIIGLDALEEGVLVLFPGMPALLIPQLGDGNAVMFYLLTRPDQHEGERGFFLPLREALPWLCKKFETTLHEALSSLTWFDLVAVEGWEQELLEMVGLVQDQPTRGDIWRAWKRNLIGASQVFDRLLRSPVDTLSLRSSEALIHQLGDLSVARRERDA